MLSVKYDDCLHSYYGILIWYVVNYIMMIYYEFIIDELFA